jgi:hypothetical protein
MMATQSLKFIIGISVEWDRLLLIGQSASLAQKTQSPTDRHLTRPMTVLVPLFNLTHIRLAEAVTLVKDARARIPRTWGAFYAQALAGEEITGESRAQCRIRGFVCDCRLPQRRDESVRNQRRRCAS